MDRQLDEQDSAEKYLDFKRRVMVFDNNFIFRLWISSEPFVSNILLTWYYIKHGNQIAIFLWI